MRKCIARIGAGVVAAGAAAGLVLSAASVASAGVGPTQTSPSLFGYYIHSASGEGVITNQFSLYLRKSAEDIGHDGFHASTYGPGDSFSAGSLPASCPGFAGNTLEGCALSAADDTTPTFGAMGGTICNENWTIQYGYILNNDGTFDAVYVDGPTTGPINCAKEGLLINPSLDVHVLLSGLPQGDSVAWYVSHNQHGLGAKVEATDLSNGDSAYTEFHWAHTVTYAGAGVFIDPSLVTNSLDNEIAAFWHLKASDTSGTLDGYGNSSDWTAYQVNATNSGVTYGSPKSTLNANRFFDYTGQPVV